MLRHVPDPRADPRPIPTHIEAKHGSLAAGRLEQPEQDLDEGALARSVGADQPDHARLDVQRQVVEGKDVAGIAVRERPHFDEGHRPRVYQRGTALVRRSHTFHGATHLRCAVMGQPMRSTVRAQASQASTFGPSGVVAELFDAALDAVVLMDRFGHIAAWNRRAEETFGWTVDEVVGQRLSEVIIPKEQRLLHERGLRRTNNGKPHQLGQRLRLSALHRDGHEFPVELTIIALGAGAGHGKRRPRRRAARPRCAIGPWSNACRVLPTSMKSVARRDS